MKHAVRVLAALLLASMFVAAVHDTSRAWDVGYYHLPFAARLGGVLSNEAFTFHAANQARFEGFPLLGDLLQGALWRITGRAECANLVAFATVPLFAWFLHRRYRVAPSVAVLALLAIPLVQLHATSCYVDLPANAAAAALVLLAIEVYAATTPPSGRTLLAAALAAGVAINTKFQTHPVVLAALIAIAARAIPSIVRDRPKRLRSLAIAAVVLPIIFTTPLKNLAIHHNPYFPERLAVLGHDLPGTEAPYHDAPPWLENASRPVRFACSLLEIGLRPITSRRHWTVDQWMDDANGNRMGGFFNAFVIVNLALLAWRAIRDPCRAMRARAIGFAILTAVVAMMPQSHELRYYMDWMIVLVSLNLVSAYDDAETSIFLAPRVYAAISMIALGAVLAVTRCGYVYASGSTFAELVHEQVGDGAIANIRDGERICVRHEPWNILWAAPFHAPRRYFVTSAERAEECPASPR